MLSHVDDRDHDHDDDHGGVHHVYLFYSYLLQTNLFDDHLGEHPKHSLRVLTIVDQLLHLFVQESQLLHIQNPHDHESIHQSHDYQ